MHPSFRTIAPGLSVVILGACFNFDATMVGGPLLSDAGDDGSGQTVLHDAGVKPVSDAGTLDAGMIQAEAGAAEAGTDASPVNAPDGGSYCLSITPSSGVFFCDDFDDDPLPGSWNAFVTTGGTLTETDAGARSPPNSLDETTLPLALYDPINVGLRKEPFVVPSFPATLHFGFSIDPLQIDPSSVGAIVLSDLDFLDAAGNRYSLDLDINTTSAGAPALVFAEQAGFEDGGSTYLPHPLPPSQPLPMNAWTDLVIVINWTSLTTAQASVSVNGGEELAPVSLTMTVQATYLQIGIGTTYVNEPSPGWELRYDNVWFTEN